MRNEKEATTRRFDVNIELFGTARMACGQRRVHMEVFKDSSLEDIIKTLSEIHPELVGTAIREDLTGLMESYIFNLNGTEFLSDDRLFFNQGDTLMLFSSQAGG